MNDAADTRPPLDRETLDTLLTGIPGEVHLHPACPSTNAIAADLAREGAAAGTVVVTDHQTAGRGRLDRRWETPPRAALTFSVLLRPTAPLPAWPWLPLLTGVAVHDALATHGVEVALKWPNDVLLADRKLAGILVERIETGTGPAATVGIGLNVTTRPDELPVDTATSIAAATGSAPDRERLLATLVSTLLDRYDGWRRQGSEAVRAAYLAACATVGQQVRVELPGGRTVHGTATGIDADGRLEVEHAEGVLAVGAGDVIHVRRSE